MKPQSEAAVRAGVEAFVAGLLQAMRAEATPAQDVPERLLSIDEAAATLGVARSTLYGQLGSGRGHLHSIVVGRRRLVAASAIREFVTDRGGATDREAD